MGNHKETKRLLDNDDNNEINPPVTSRVNIIKGLISGLIYVIVLVATATWVALLEKSISDFELFSLRSGFTWIMCVVILIYRKEFPKIPFNEIVNVGLYSFFGNSVGLTHIAVTLIPASSVQCVLITSSIVSGVILYWIFLREKVTLKNALSAVACIVGVVLIIQPDFFFKMYVDEALSNPGNLSEMTTTTTPVETMEQGPLLMVTGYLLAMTAGVMLTAEAILFKKCPFLMENVITAVFWASLVATVVAAIISASVEDIKLPSTWIHGFYVFGQSVGFSLLWPAFYYAVKYLSGNTVNMVFSTSVVFFLISQYTVLSSIHPGHRNWMEVVGVCFVLIGSILKSTLELL